MYVPGVIKQTEKVLVDVGTGYDVEKDIPAARDYFNRKVKFVTQNMERVQAIGSEKAKIRDMVMDIMQEKLQAQFAGMKAPNKS
jgi:prefoldin alpha subunit